MAWAVTFYQSRTGKVPARDFLANRAPNVRRKLLVVLEVVRAAPPPSFSGGGMWEAMHGTMNGYYEIRTTGPGRRHYRLYCILDNGSKAELAERGFRQPHIVVVNGLVKPNASLSASQTCCTLNMGTLSWRAEPVVRLACCSSLTRKAIPAVPGSRGISAGW